MFKVQFWSRNDNSWIQHSVNVSRTAAFKELFFLEESKYKVRIIHDGRIIAESEDSCELPY